MSHSTAAAPPTARRRVGRALLISVLIAFIVGMLYVEGRRLWPREDPDPWVLLRNPEQSVADRAIARIAAEWKPEYAAMVLKVAPITLHFGDREKLFDILRKKTGHSFSNDQTDDWYHWLWSQPAADSKALNRLRYDYFRASPFPFGGLGMFFANDPPLTVRADEIQYGGILPVTIQPIRSPKTISAKEAKYLGDGDVVFGVRLNGAARAYPRRIVGHHQIVTDTVGGEPITAVYCPLCDAMIPFHSRTADGTLRVFGVSGFLYRSNWLLYDIDTKSLWYTLTGAPILGPAVTSGVCLQPIPVVTASWKEWRTANPDTRTIPMPEVDDEDPIDYSEGGVYGKYFATDALWQPVPELDHRLKNKDSVFVPRPRMNSAPVAVSAAFLGEHPVYQLSVDSDKVLVVTSPGGANRAFNVGARTFKPGTTPSTVVDDRGIVWTVGEEGLTAHGQATMPRVPGHRSFWFAWHAAYPDTALIK